MNVRLMYELKKNLERHLRVNLLGPDLRLIKKEFTGLRSHKKLRNTGFDHTYGWLYSYTGCPGRNVPDFGRMFLKLKYTDITQNTYIRS